ncbi:MAG TPA: hypothetical protein PLJ78_14535 [Anaerolineae bacterium]|mgnify:CR=1 FL=1|nr:hypothetical protein [Anaerolineae bacterium]HQK15149.1 hypothetical protein [Anaerolineae bacterium]
MTLGIGKILRIVGNVFSLCVFLVAICIIVLWIALALLPHQAPDINVEQLVSRVSVGNQRVEALQSYTDAWFHIVCSPVIDNSVGMHDLFFYGPHDREKAVIINVASRGRGDTYVIVQITHFENYWLGTYPFDDGTCVPSPSLVFQ